MQPTKALLSRHPWFAAFDAAPPRALDAVLRGAAYVPPYQRASPAQKIEGLFGDLPADASEWQILDDTLCDWLQQVRADTDAAMVRSGGAASFIAETGDALRLVWRLKLEKSAKWICENLMDLRGWAEPLLLDDEAYDLPKALLAAAAQLQTSRDWVHLWLGECRRAATPRLYHRVDTALTGLARMPPPPNTIGGLNHEVLVGLASWGTALPTDDFKAKNAFLRRWRTIKASFPRSGEQWRHDWRDLLDNKVDQPFTKWLKDEEPALRRPATPRKEPLLPHCVNVIQGFARELDADGLTEQLWGRMRTLIRKTERFAEITGDCYNLVRSCTNIASLIQEDAPGHAVALTRLALIWNRHNGHAWSVRARSLEKLRRPAIAESALWEGLRNAPESTALYGQLAIMLVDQERLSEAEYLLRAATAIDSEDAVVANELARLLWRKGKAEEAITLLEEHAARPSSNSAPLYSLGSLFLAEGRLPEAQSAVTRYRQLFRNDTRINGLADRIRRSAIDEQKTHLHEPRPRGAVRAPVAWDEFDLNPEESEAAALAHIRSLTEADRRLRSGDDETRRSALATVDTALEEDSADSYAHVIKALACTSYRPSLVARQETRFTNDLAIHLALTGPDTPTNTWCHLLARFPQDTGLILLTRLGHGGSDADGGLAEWVETEPPRDDHWKPFIRKTLRRHFNGENLPLAISPPMLAHDAILRRVEVGWGLVGNRVSI
ncbi:tetratricopeptide repeat protein [Insolitispirillum peregrinum]|uniref:Uncharacterized protein n=1 Tax=Insolitispirillum peregrinum TaxID=80876 RepID=A0A1N7JYZ1_9PROT|nr:tetratricopeptide repeat protein [Insolitispirillum peregrinum]SIS54547.1 hypothetical protein SAMN05421779_102529 [Insolitispirillum peregrinum]